jgi:hypothetical protein
LRWHGDLGANPDYLNNAPSICSPRELAGHRCQAIRENDEDVTLFANGRSTARVS